MKVAENIVDARLLRSALDEPVGFVPTMGFLHEGHLSLVRASKGECRSTVVSIFVNPTQFSPNEDLKSYPRDLERDLQLLENAGVDLVWTPTSSSLYPPGYQTWVDVENLTRPLEGEVRPGHFRGVTTIVTKLFNVIQPQKAFFGQKDAQQAAVLRRMSADLNFPIDIIVCPTVREPDGLAMSSRNSYLGSQERMAAPVIFRSLSEAVKACENGERNAERLRRLIHSIIACEPLARVEYVSCADPQTLTELETINTVALFSAAVYVGRIRLIDNLIYQADK